MATRIEIGRGGPYQWPFMASSAVIDQAARISQDAWDALSIFPMRPAQGKTLLTENLAQLYFQDQQERYRAGQAAIAQAVRILLGSPEYPIL